MIRSSVRSISGLRILFDEIVVRLSVLNVIPAQSAHMLPGVPGYPGNFGLTSVINQHGMDDRLGQVCSTRFGDLLGSPVRASGAYYGVIGHRRHLTCAPMWPTR